MNMNTSTRRKTLTCLMLGSPNSPLRVVGLMHLTSSGPQLKSVNVYASQAEALEAIAKLRNIGRYLMGRTDYKEMRPVKFTQEITIHSITGSTSEGDNIYSTRPYNKRMQFWPEKPDTTGFRPEWCKKLYWYANEVFTHGPESIDARCILPGWRPVLLWHVQVTAQVQGERWDSEAKAKVAKTLEYKHNLQHKDLDTLKIKVADVRKQIKAKGGHLLPVTKDAYVLRWVPVSREKAEEKEETPVAPHGVVPAIA